MLNRLSLVCLLILSISTITAQEEEPIQILEEQVANRLFLHALNETDIDYDIRITVEGTGFRQSKSKPRLIRVPATSKVKSVARLMLVKGQEPNYTYKLEVNDSLSRRAMRKEFKKVKIKPNKPITIYFTDNCRDCDSLITPLQNSKWVFTKIDLAEKTEIKEQLKMAVPGIDSITTPIYSYGGLIFPKVKTYEALLEEMNKE